jgi:hypothetical protein
LLGSPTEQLYHSSTTNIDRNEEIEKVKKKVRLEEDWLPNSTIPSQRITFIGPIRTASSKLQIYGTILQTLDEK